MKKQNTYLIKQAAVFCVCGLSAIHLTWSYLVEQWMTIEKQNASLIQPEVSCEFSAIHLELTEIMDYNLKAKCIFDSASISSSM